MHTASPAAPKLLPKLRLDRPQITTPTLDDGQLWEIYPGVLLDARVQKVGTKARRTVIVDGRIGQVRPGDQIKISIQTKGNLPDDLAYLGVIEVDGEDWKNVTEYCGMDIDEDGKAFETFVPVLDTMIGKDTYMAVTKSSSNALKLVTISKSGVYKEYTIAVTIEDHDPNNMRNGYATLLQQHNYHEQIYRDPSGVAFLPRTRSTGGQPKRLAVVDIIKNTLEGVSDKLPLWQPGRNYQPAPSTKGLCKGLARMMFWSNRRRVGGAVLHDGTQVRVYAGNIIGGIYLEQDSIVRYESLADIAKGVDTRFRVELIGASFVRYADEDEGE